MTTLAAAAAAVLAVSTQVGYWNFTPPKEPVLTPIFDSVLILDATKVKVCRLRVTVDCDEEKAK